MIVVALLLGGSSGSPIVAVATGVAPSATAGPSVLPGSPAPIGDLAASSQEPTALPTESPTVLPAATAEPATSPTITIAPTLRPTAITFPTPAPRATPRPASTPPVSTPTPTAAPIAPLSACSIFPTSNVWNRRVDGLTVAADSAARIAAIGIGGSLHPDFSAAGGYGIPYNVVGSSTPRSGVAFQYADESDPGPYPIPTQPKIEGGSDRHVLMVDTSACTLFELYSAVKGGSGWTAGSGAIWDLGSNALRPSGWTSADAAGLPIFPGLVRYAEVAAGAIRHAIRFTAPTTCNGFVYPARHEAGSGSCAVEPPMGLRIRLKASVDISGFGPQSQVILTALQRYGMLLADNGSPWYITGAPDSHWNDDELHGLGALTGADFEVVDTTGFVNG